MNCHEFHLAQILAQPLELTPALVYGGWLAGANDPHALDWASYCELRRVVEEGDLTSTSGTVGNMEYLVRCLARRPRLRQQLELLLLRSTPAPDGRRFADLLGTEEAAQLLAVAELWVVGLVSDAVLQAHLQTAQAAVALLRRQSKSSSKSLPDEAVIQVVGDFAARRRRHFGWEVNWLLVVVLLVTRQGRTETREHAVMDLLAAWVHTCVNRILALARA